MMTRPRTDPKPRGVLVALAAVLVGAVLTEVAVLLARLAWATAAGARQPLAPADLLVAVAAAAAALVAVRLVLCSAACVVAVALAVVGSGTADRAVRIAVTTSPKALRPGLGALLAGSIALGVAGPALAAAPVSTSTGVVRPEQRSTAVDAQPGLPSPEWAALPAPGWLPPAPRRAPAPVRGLPATHLVTGPVVPDTAARGRTADDEMVVRRGDTLWHIAARSLGPGAAVAEIAAEWPRWWRANRDAIGADPDLLVPGTRLHAPAPADPTP